MYVAYVDESGDDGPAGSRAYVLGCVMVKGADWQPAFDQIIGFRRWAKSRFGLLVRAEVKANYLLRNGGPFRARPLSEAARRDLYRAFLRLHPKLQLTVFAVVIDKSKTRTMPGGKRLASDIAWEYLLQRLERRATKENTQILVMHDEGDERAIRARARKARRAGTAGSAFGTGSLKVPFLSLLDDPVAKNSAQSYFVQCADLVAYSAFRAAYPLRLAPSKSCPPPPGMNSGRHGSGGSAPPGTETRRASWWVPRMGTAGPKAGGKGRPVVRRHGGSVFGSERNSRPGRDALMASAPAVDPALTVRHGARDGALGAADHHDRGRHRR